jgi:LPS-assembly lipoprotein
MRKSKVINQALITAVVVFSLTACGFHLRGNIPLPDGVKNLFLRAAQGSFRDQLEEILVSGGAVLARNKAAGDVMLNITKVGSKRTVGTLDDRGKVNSYNLIFTVQYSLESPDGKIVRTETLKESRRYDFSPELVIESESEEAELLESMEQDLSLRIVRQLSSMVDYPELPKPATAK